MSSSRFGTGRMSWGGRWVVSSARIFRRTIGPSRCWLSTMDRPMISPACYDGSDLKSVVFATNAMPGRRRRATPASWRQNAIIWRSSIRTTCGSRTSSPSRLRSCGRWAMPSVARHAGWRGPEGHLSHGPGTRTTFSPSPTPWGCYLSPGTTMVCEPRIFAEVGLFDTNLQRHEDWDWLLRLTARYDVAYLPEPLASREPSAFGNHHQTLEAIERMRRKHLLRLPQHLRRRFEAGLALEEAAARYRQRNWGGGASGETQ